MSLLPRWLRNTLRKRQIENRAEAQGLGRHKKEEVIEMGFKDLRALSNFLGTILLELPSIYNPTVNIIVAY